MEIPKYMLLKEVKEYKRVNKEVLYTIIDFMLFNGVDEMPNIVIDMLKVYDYGVYTLLDLGVTLSFSTTFITRRFPYVLKCYMIPFWCLPPLVCPLLLKTSIGDVLCPFCIKSCVVI